MFLPAPVILSRELGACMAGGMHGRGCAWQDGMHGRGVCVAGGGACMAGGGCAWQGACVTGGMHGRREATAADGTHPGGMHSCSNLQSLGYETKPVRNR